MITNAAEYDKAHSDLRILESHPRLTREAVLAALGYAAEAMKHETVHAADGHKPI